jgi:hypothetical protein
VSGKPDHGKYVSCVARVTEILGVPNRDAIVVEAAHSECLFTW